MTTAEWAAFLARYRELLAGARVVTLSGSLPPGVPDDCYATLIGLARAAGVGAVLDADGGPAYLGVRAGPDVVKPNAAELSRLHSRLLGRRISAGGLAEAEEAAAAVRALGAGSVVASLSEVGLVADSGDGIWHAAPPEKIDGNATGAGDALVAALARGLWPVAPPGFRAGPRSR